MYLLCPDHNFKTIAPVQRLTFGHMFDGEPMAQAWESIEMKLFDEGRKKLKRGDFPGHPITPFFSQKAADALNGVLQPAGELLPTSCGDEIYYTYNVLNVVDAVDLERSDVIRTPNGRVIRINRYFLNTDAIQGQYIFKIPVWKHASTIYATEALKCRIEEAGLLGFDFKLLPQ